MCFLYFLASIFLFYLLVALYLRYSRSYSNSYVGSVIARGNVEFSLFNIMAFMLTDRSLVALLIYRLNFRISNKYVGRFLTNIGFFFTSIEIYFNAKIGYRVQIWHGQGTVIGQNAIVGDDCLILNQVTLGSGFVILGSGVKVGAGAKILGSISIGDGCIIGANTVVTCNLEPRTLVSLPINRTSIRDGVDFKFGTRP